MSETIELHEVLSGFAQVMKGAVVGSADEQAHVGDGGYDDIKVGNWRLIVFFAYDRFVPHEGVEDHEALVTTTLYRKDDVADTTLGQSELIRLLKAYTPMHDAVARLVTGSRAGTPFAGKRIQILPPVQAERQGVQADGFDSSDRQARIGSYWIVKFRRQTTPGS